MKTTTCPKSHKELGTGCSGLPYGHVPGHYYDDVEVCITHRGQSFRCQVVQSWGSAQGYDEEQGRNTVAGYGDSLDSACGDAARRAKESGIDAAHLQAAMAKARDEAEDAQCE